jgi:16S rRNA processing protein RimM
MQVAVGRIGKAHGVRGEVAVEVRTDDPDRRFADGAVLVTDPPERGPLTVVRSRPHAGRLLVQFDGVADRTAAAMLRGTLLTVDSTGDPPLDDPDEFYDHQLVGLVAFSVGGEPLGDVEDVLHPPGPDLLVLRRPTGEETLVPFVASIVPTVDLAAGRLVVDPPEGLLDLAAPEQPPA